MATYENNIISELLYNDGEALDYNDLNNAQRHARSMLYDGVHGTLARVVERDYQPHVVSATEHAWTIGNGCQPYVSASTLTVSFTPGAIGQKASGVPDGTDPLFLWYHMGLAEVSLTAGAADATNPRWDIVQIKIEHAEGSAETRDFSTTAGVLSSVSFSKRRRTRLTASIKAGTAAASPTEPTPDAGYVKLCAIHIAATATVITPTTVRDYRMPVGYRVIDLIPGIHCALDSEWVHDISGMVTSDNNATPRRIFAYPQFGAPFASGRLLAVGVSADQQNTGGTAILQSYNFGTVTLTPATVLDISASVLSTTDRYMEVALWDSAIWMDGTSAPSCQGGAGNASGYGEATIGAGLSTTTMNKLVLKITNAANSQDTIKFIRFIVAGM